MRLPLDPETIKGFLDPAEGKALHDAALERAPFGPCLEIGAYCGKSALYLGSACQAAGGDALAERAEAKLGIALGGTTADQRLTLEPIYCLGLCATAPSAMLDGRLIGRLDATRIDAIVAETQQ